MPRKLKSEKSESNIADEAAMKSHEWDTRGRFRICLKCQISQCLTARFTPDINNKTWLPLTVPKCSLQR